MSTSTDNSRIVPILGAAGAFVLYLIFALGPSVEFGHHMGEVMWMALMDQEPGEGLFARFVILGGTALGMVATLSFMLICGGFLGTMVDLLIHSKGAVSKES